MGGLFDTAGDTAPVTALVVGVERNSDFNEEHAETKRHSEAARQATANRGCRMIFI
jgi:hypothetical protein